jgi:hypothetical protein
MSVLRVCIAVFLGVVTDGGMFSICIIGMSVESKSRRFLIDPFAPITVDQLM